jgi:hypothetical protein
MACWRRIAKTFLFAFIDDHSRPSRTSTTRTSPSSFHRPLECLHSHPARDSAGRPGEDHGAITRRGCLHRDRRDQCDRTSQRPPESRSATHGDLRPYQDSRLRRQHSNFETQANGLRDTRAEGREEPPGRGADHLRPAGRQGRHQDPDRDRPSSLATAATAVLRGPQQGPAAEWILVGKLASGGMQSGKDQHHHQQQPTAGGATPNVHDVGPVCCQALAEGAKERGRRGQGGRLTSKRSKNPGCGRHRRNAHPRLRTALQAPVEGARRIRARRSLSVRRSTSHG